MTIMTQQRIEVSLAGQRITLATTAEHEPLLRQACALVDEQIQLALAGGNRSIERATMMAAIKLAGDLISMEQKPQIDNPTADPEHLQQIEQEVLALEEQVDVLLNTLSLPGAPRPIVP
jgi:cell division protein ZapA